VIVIILGPDSASVFSVGHFEDRLPKFCKLGKLEVEFKEYRKFLLVHSRSVRCLYSNMCHLRTSCFCYTYVQYYPSASFIASGNTP
jgi:hypothetical protein